MFGGSFLEKQEVSDDFTFKLKEVYRDGEGRRGMKRFSGRENKQMHIGPEDREIKGLECHLV